MELTRAVGENLKRIRKSKKLSMERLAAEAGVSRSMLGQIERGEANPSVGLLGKLAGALKVPAEVLLENDDFEPLLLLRELDNKAARLDGGKALLRPSLPYDDVLRQETLDLYISGRYAPEPMVPGCVCLATSLSGTVLLHAEGQDFQLLERDALRFAADQPFWLENQFNGTARLLLTYRYLRRIFSCTFGLPLWRTRLPWRRWRPPASHQRRLPRRRRSQTVWPTTQTTSGCWRRTTARW